MYDNPDKNLTTATFELPGVPKNKVDIEYHDGGLTVSCDVAQSSEQQEQGYTIKERRSGKFIRTVKLPAGTNVSDD